MEASVMLKLELHGLDFADCIDTALLRFAIYIQSEVVTVHAICCAAIIV